ALEMDRLEALISKQQDDYQKRPKRKSVGARAKEYHYALYVESWRQKVEKIGTLNYPEAAKNSNLYGQLLMTVSIKSDGSIESIEIKRSSGHKVLDEAAKRIVELGAPYARFPDDIRKEIDVLSITRTLTFTKEDHLATAAE
ncbi:MAG: energy transducer TonB, partial [Methylotenera sp.]